MDDEHDRLMGLLAGIIVIAASTVMLLALFVAGVELVRVIV